MSENQAFLDLLARAREGDEEAMSDLVRQYEAEVRIVARARLGAALRPYIDSVDLVQSVHRSLIIGLRNDRFELTSPENLIALAVAIVRRKVARHWRRVRRQQRLSAQLDPTQELSHVLVSLSQDNVDPAAVVTMKDQVESVLRTLDENDRQLIELRLDGFGTAEAARKLGLDPDVSRVRLNRLRKRLEASGVKARLV